MTLAETLKQFVEESLGILLGTGAEEILIQLGGTIILFIVVRKYFWKNITAFIEKRKALMDDEMAAARLLKDEALQIKEATDQEIKELKLSLQTNLEVAKKSAEKEREHIISKAKQDAIRIKAEAEKELEQDLLKAQAQIKREIITVAKALTEKVIDETLDDKHYEKWLDKATDEVRQS